MTNTNWNELATTHHAAMVANGFHENYSHTDLLLRGIQEVGEAASAWRKNRRADMAVFSAFFNKPDNLFLMYESYIKHSMEEELADIALIMLDFAATSGIYIDVKGFVSLGTPPKLLMRISKFICYIDNICQEYEGNEKSIVSQYVNSIFSNLEKLANDLSINLEEQVKLKMQYNTTREYRHGDKN